MQIGIRRTGSNVLDRKARRQLRQQNKQYRQRKRLWGTDQHFGGSPVIAKSAGRATVSGARFAIFFTGIAWFVYLVEQVMRVAEVGLTTRTLVETAVYLILVTLLTASAIAYLLSRLGYFHQINHHRRVPRSTIDNHFSKIQPSMTVLVPSYREEERIVRLTLLSAALQEYPNLRVTLLIDDPPNPTDPEHQKLLKRSRNLIATLNDYLEKPRHIFEKALRAFEQTNTQERLADATTLQHLAITYDTAARWFEREEVHLKRTDHIDEFYAIEVLNRTAQDLRTTGQAIRIASQQSAPSISRQRVHQLYSRLLHIFQAEFTSFERKQFASLSHEPNKAMNLNSYIGLMGGEYSVVTSPGGRVLIPADGRQPDLSIPDCDYILTLDADSILLPEYCLRLVYFMEQKENAEYAISQTPYSAYRGTPSRIERIAGASTDIQHIVHLGLTKQNATFWVGANAVIRKPALDALEQTEEESGFTIRRYISDRTVIEDTESSIDLRKRGWKLYNYPERLSYSATPPDFGSLVIQRQRWANGGLVILPKLLKLIGRRKKEGAPRLKATELFLRISYLASISWASVSLLLLLFYPFEEQLLSRFAVLTALPYWWAMANDLKRVGYRRRDVFQVYGFNLLLLPVNLAGTIQSVIQAIGGQRTAFARTPKVADRTIAPLSFVLLPLILIGWSAWTLQHDIADRAYIHGAFAAANLVTTLYACFAFIGFKNIIVDIFINLREFIYRPVKSQTAPQEVPHWASVLYVGGSVPEEIKTGAPLAVALAAQDLFASSGDAMMGKRPFPHPQPNGIPTI